MTIFMGTDHNGYELKTKLVEYLQEKDIRVEDMGNYTFDAQDDYTEYGRKVAQAVLQNTKEFLGIAICGSGIGMSIITNRFKGIRAALCGSVKQVQHGRTNDHVNVLCLAAEYLTLQEAKEIVDAFISTPIKEDEKYFRRNKQLDN